MIDVHKKDLNKLFSQIKASAKKRGIPFDLTRADLGRLTFPITCPILGFPLKFNTGKVQFDSYSIDRIDNTMGYTVDNIIVVSHRVNQLKSNASLEEMKLIVEFYETI